jgi:phage-related protein
MELFKLFGTIAVNNDEANRSIEETTGKAEKSESTMSSAFKKIGAAVTTYFAVDKIVDFGKAIVNTAAEVDAETSAFSQIMGDYTDNAKDKLNAVADTTGVMATRMQGHFTSLSAKFKGLGFDVGDATDLAQRGLTLAADAAAFWDVSLDDSSAHLNSFINGSYEGGEAIGLFANDTQLAMYAVQQGIVASTEDWAKLDEATKQATRLDYAENMYKQSGATGQAAREADQYANVQANLNEKWRQFKAEIGQPLLQNVVLPAMQKLSELVGKLSPAFERLKQWVSDNKEELQHVATVIGNLAEIAVYATGVFLAFKAGMAIQGVVQGFQSAQVALSLLSMQIGGANLAQATLNGTLTIGETIVGLLTGKIKLATLAQGLMAKGQAALNAVMAANPIALIVLAIAALVAAFIYLWNNCEGFRNFWIGLWDGIKNVVGAVVDWIKENWQTMLLFLVNPLAGVFKYCYEHFEGFRNFVDNTINAIKNFFVGLWNKVVEVFTSIIDWIKENWQAMLLFLINPLAGIFKYCYDHFEGFRNFVNKVINDVKGFFVDLWNKVAEVFTSIANAAKNTWDRIKNTFSSVGSWFKNIFQQAYKAVTDVFSKIGSFFGKLWDSIKNTFTKLGATISNAIGGAVKAGINGIISGIENTINRAIRLINGAIKLINKLPGVNVGLVSELKMPRLAKGGIVDKPTIAQVGENGKEAIVPLEKNTGWIDEVAERLDASRKNNPAENEAIIRKLDEMIEAIKKLKIYLDSDVLVGELTPEIDNQLGNINRLRVRGQ